MIEASQKIEVITYELRVQLSVDVPVSALMAYGDDPTGLRDDEILGIIAEDTDRVPNALSDLLERHDFTTRYVEVFYTEDDAHEVDKPEPARFAKPEDGELYTLPIPNFISGNVKFTNDGIEAIEESPLNLYTDEQLRGAYAAAKRIWGLRGMHRYQQTQLAEYISELQWGMLARPTLHTFRESEGRKGGPTAKCSYCGMHADAHPNKEKDEK